MSDSKQWTCPNCGTVNSSKFCTKCGMKNPSMKADEPSVWICPQCGAQNKGKFCIKCGQPKKSSVMQTAVEQTQIIPPVQSTQGPSAPVSQPMSAADIAKNISAPSAGAPSASHMKQKQALLIAVILILAGVLGYFGYREFFADNGTGYQPVAKQSAAKEDAPAREMKTDLSLGGLDLGDDTSAISEVEKSAEKKDPHQEGSMLRHYYDNMEIVEENGKITALVSQDDSVSTKRGLHQGSTLDEVQKAYGTDTFSKSDDGEGRTLYEYKFTGLDGRIGLLRFAVKDNKVDYISVRTYEGAQQPAGVKAPNQANASNDTESAKGTLRNFHSAISSKNLSAAWNLMTPEQQNRMGGYDSFRNGYSTTLSSTVSNISVASSSSDKVVLNYTLTARDRADGGKVKVQNFNGTATLVKQDGGWKIAYTESTKTGEHMQ
ncbi:hypothetical protein [Mitsuokella sp. WILCCON 0060]|uniref:zinc ribbon domain-containing protein n=1 Tax=unclassified Mitsuokella TaxID=2637239 RepID=UPI003F0C64C2